MTSSELHRKLLYCGYDDMSAYLMNKPINQYMHKLMLDLCEKHQIEVPVLTLFNEVYYQCARVQYDGDSYGEVRTRYLVEEQVWLQSDKAAELVFSMVWALYQRKANRSEREDFLIENISLAIFDSEFLRPAYEFVHYMEEHGLRPYKLFLTKPIRIKMIPKRIDLEYHTSMTLKEKIFRFFSLPVESSARDFNPWRNVTDNYSEKVIKFYITLYTDRQSQIELLERIESACTKDEYKAHKDMFDQLDYDVHWGAYVPGSGSYICYEDEEEDVADALYSAEKIRDRELFCGYSSKEAHIGCADEEYEQLVSQAIAANAAQLLDEFDKEQLRNPRIRSLIGKLLAVSTYCSRKVFISYASGDTSAYHLIDFLKRTMLQVEIDDTTGQVTTDAQVEPRPRWQLCSLEKPKPEEESRTVTVEADNNKTVYVIQNLNIYLNAEIVQQLNINPQQVINQLHEQIKEELNSQINKSLDQGA